MIKYLFFFVSLFFSACGGASAPSKAAVVNPLLLKGESVYKANCIACHNPDPAKNGSLGPSIAHSSLELIEARILRASYPEGYQPKRNSRLMPAMPQLESDLEALHAFLNQ